MATTQKIEIPVSLSAQIENLREIRQTLTATLNSAGKDSSLAKTLTKDLSKINQMLGEVEEFALSPTIDESGLKQLQKVLDNFYKQAQSSFSNANFANFEAIASESDLARLKTLTAEAAKYRRELETLRKSGSSERTDAYLLRAGRQDLLGKAQAQKGFDSTTSLGKNALAMERAAESYQRSADAMQTAIEKLESEANAAIANAQQAAQQVKTLEQQSQTLGADTQAARFHHAAGRFKTAIVANRGVENPTINSVERGLRSALESVQANGKIATDARNAVGDWIKHLFPQLPTSDIASMVGQDINTLLSDLMERIFGSGYLDTDVIYSPEHSAILSRAQDYSRSEINRIAGVHSTANVLDLTTRSQQVNSDLRKAKSRWTAYNNEADSKVTSWLEMTDQQEELTAAAQATAQLSQELYTLADAAQKAAIASKEAQIQQNAEAQQDLKEGATRPTRQLAQRGKMTARQHQISDESFVSELNENLKGAKIDANEAEQFTNNLKQSITHWMSAQQIINLVKDGIRQAYQDIKNLDAAMTNIAVVTDMSVSDLWGKINEYMSIAQQYGVTTQGVYEVSQLYYQQGLSTNEVMAATTETLKMARIAGMGYAEAADAMTVAIRSFKMEMSDAGHVTDVYSKVAAITASDSEELAIAMSKTASSAESVGSSFENTTAMLAVMVETTRESAQNLGSALKSIISRYGEMKSGMTQDSDGEIIDYNKTDAALRSIGISLKDAQGQFRDFDDVIFELSAKWDSLDKNTQRYIATIMAGNRQQSRFIALVDNWERLEEVTGAAQDSEDAGLLQYAKTLDSLDTKLNNLKTSFQSFYMSIFNGEFFKGFIDIITNVVDNLSKVGPLLGGINLLQLINQIKLVGQLLLNTFSKNIGKIQQSSKEWQKSFTNGWPTVGERIGDVIAKALVAKAKEAGMQFADEVEAGAKQQTDDKTNSNTPQTTQTAKVAPKLNIISQKLVDRKLNAMLPETQAQVGEIKWNTRGQRNRAWSDTSTMVEQYSAAANKILENQDRYSEAAINWANTVKTSCEKFQSTSKSAGNEIKRGAVEAARKELSAADEEARIELSAAQKAKETTAKQFLRDNGGQIAMAAGTLLSTYGMTIDQSTMAGYDKSTAMQAGGSILSVVGQVATGNYIGAAISAVTGIITAIERITNRAKVELENAKKAAEEANVERAEKKDKWKNLETYAKKLKEAEAARYDSNEAEQEWLNLNNEIAEKYPELISYIDAEGNSIVNLTEDYEGLSQAKKQYLEQEAEYWDKKVKEAALERDSLSETKIQDFRNSHGSAEGVTNTANAVAGRAYDAYGASGQWGQYITYFGEGKDTDLDFLNGGISNKASFLGENLEELIANLNLNTDQAYKLIKAWEQNNPGKNFFGATGWDADFVKDWNRWSSVTKDGELKLFLEAASQYGNIVGDVAPDALLQKHGIKSRYNEYLSAANALALGRNFESLEDIDAWVSGFSGKGIESLLTEGVNLQALLTYANDSEKILGSSLAQLILNATGLAIQDGNGKWVVDEEQQQIWDKLVKYQQNEALYDSYIRSSISSNGNLLLHGTETAELLSGMSGYEQLLLQGAERYTEENDMATLSQFRDSAAAMSAIYKDYAAEVGKWFAELPPALKTEFNDFVSNQGDYTLSEVQNLLTDKFSITENGELYQDLINNWWETTNTAKYRAMKRLWEPEDKALLDQAKEEDLLSYDTWKTNTDLVEQVKAQIREREGKDRYVSNEEAYNEYVKSIIEKWKVIGIIDETEAAILEKRSAVELEQLSTFMSVRKEMSAKAAAHRKGKIDSDTATLREAWNSLLNGEAIDIFGLNTADWKNAQKEEFASLLVSKNVGTSDWLEEIVNFAEKYHLGIESIRAEAAKYVATSFSTEVALLTEATDEFKTTLENFTKKQQQGYTFTEATQLINQLKAVGVEDTLAEVFEVNEQGLLVLKNFNKTCNDLYTSQLEKYTNYQGELSKLMIGVSLDENGKLVEDLVLQQQKTGTNVSVFETLLTYSQTVGTLLTQLGNETEDSPGYNAVKGQLILASDNIKSFLTNALGIDTVTVESIIRDLEANNYQTTEEIYNYLQSKAEELKISSEMLKEAFISSLSQYSFTKATEQYANALNAKNATSASSFKDLDAIWKERAKYTNLKIDDQDVEYSKWSLKSQNWDQYYSEQLAALTTHGAQLDAFGNLIVNNWVAWGEYIADSYGYSEAAIQDAIENDDPDTAVKLSAARAQILQSAKTSQIELQETTLKNIQGGLENLYTSFIEDGEIEFSEVENILTTLQPRITDGNYAKLLQLYEQAKSRTAEDFKTFIDELANLARAAGYNISEDEITAKIQDAYTSLVKTLFDSLSNAIKGSLTADDLGSLETSLGLDLSAYQQQTLDGYQLSSEGLLKVAGELEHRYGNVAGYAEKMAELFVGKDKLYSGREELEARIAEIEKVKEAKKAEEDVSKELEYQLSLLKKMAATSRLNKDDPLFNFMNQDSTKGFAAGADEMVASIDKVKSTFKSITQKQKVDVDDFYNMMDFMYKNRTDKTVTDKDWISSALGITDAQLTKFKTKSNETINTYEDFVNAIVSGSKELGKVDSKVLLDMGISMDTMSSSMAGSLQTVAKQQIDFLTNMRKTLEALQALDNIEDIPIGLDFTASDSTEVTLANFDKYYLEFDQSKLEAKIKDLIQNIEQTFENKGFDSSVLFGADGFSLQDQADRTVAKGLGQFINFYKTATEAELTNFAQQYPDILKDGGNIDWAKLKDIFAADIDWNSFASSLTADLQASIQAALANVPGITVEGLNIKWDETKAGANLEDAKAKIINAYKSQGKDIELELGKDNIFTVHIIPSNVKAIVDKAPEAWTYDFANKNYTRDLEVTTEAGTVDVQVVIDNLGNVTFTGKDGAKLDEATIKAAAESAGIYSMTGLELQADGTATANVNITASESTAATVSTIAADVSKIVELLSAGITISVDSEAANQALVTIQEAYNALKENIANNPIKISLEYDTPPELNLPPITRIVKLEYNNNPSNSSTDGESGAGGATRNFKTVAVAEAKGNVSALSIGAALAQGTLMGELGPELYVQGGQYQIAGANGPEFVDLAPDAIVFNHLQTANLLGKGHTTKTGSPITSERRAVGAYATGNVSGLAFANGSIGSAIAAIDRAISIWQNIANITAADLVGGGGGGGGGDNSIKAVTEELTKWYNLTRQIEKLEQDINNLLAERKNITDGGEYLRSLREQQQLLAQQAATQQTLLAYQEEQLGRQQEHIKNNKIWSQFLTFDESGNLQYITGNESNGGQGQLSVLEQLNKMSGEEQLNYIKNTLGYSYTDQDGKTLDGQDLVTQFFKELQEQIDSYDSLYDTVHSTEEQLQKIQTSISEIDAEIEKNQMDLEKAIYDIILDSWKKQIEQMEDQKKLAQEANEAYIENLNKALSDEREMYSQNESIADRESLQNRLALLRRSGGSASEIYDLEQQLDSMLKDEYFNKQEKMIENIEEASKEQIKKLEEQIKLEEEALEYQKENGVLWTQVYEIMQGTEESILAFMQGKAPEFFSQSTLQQKQMLTDWAKQIGIYTEDQQYKNYRKEAEDTHWDKNSWRAKISEGGVGRELAAIFDGLNADQQGTLKSLFTSTYANKMLESGDEKEALKAAIAALKAQLKSIKSQQESAAAAASGGSGGNGSGGTGQNPSSGQKPKRYRVDYTVVFVDNQIKTGYGVGSSEYEALAAAKHWAGKHTKSPTNDLYPGEAPVRNIVYGKAYAYKQGGLVDYTGPAIVHGSPSKPEAFLNAKQTAMISEAVRAVGDGGALNGIKATLAALNSTIKGIVNNDNSLTSSFTVAPGAVTIQVAQLNDSYDVEELSKDVMNRMVAIASRTTNRGVNRR